MGAGNSRTEQLPHAKKFQAYLDNKKFRLNDPSQHKRLCAAATEFFQSLDRCVVSRKVEGAPLDDLKGVLRQIDACFAVFNRFIESDKRDRTAVAQGTFKRDYRLLCQVWVSFSERMKAILNTLRRTTHLALMCEFGLAVACCSGSFLLSEMEITPFYHVRLVPIFSVLEELIGEERKYVSIVAPHSAGKTYSVPLIISMKICEELVKGITTRPFCFCIESDTVALTCLTQFLLAKGDDNYEVLTTAEEALNALNQRHRIPVIGVFSVFEALKMFSQAKDRYMLFNRSRFIIDDVHKRSVEIDVLMATIFKNIKKNKGNIPCHLIVMSSSQDDDIINYIRTDQEPVNYVIDEQLQFNVDKKELEAPNPLEITRKLVYNEAKTIIEGWKAKFPTIPLGTMVVYMPEERLCHRFASKLLKMFDSKKVTAGRPIIPLFTNVSQGDTDKTFFARVERDIKRIKDEREEAFGAKNPLFFVTIVVENNANENVLSIVTSPLSRDLVSILVRIVVLTGDAPSVYIPDITSVLDTGIHTMEYYDVKTGLSYLKEELIPQSHRDGRLKTVGRTNFGMAVSFNVNGQIRQSIPVPAVQRVDLTKPYFSLRHIGYDLKNIENLPCKPGQVLIDDCQQRLTNLGLVDAQNHIQQFGEKTLKYSFTAPVFAVGIVRFMEENENSQGACIFATLAYEIIDIGDILIVKSDTEYLIDMFDARSDLVTLIKAVKGSLEGITEDAIEYCNTIRGQGLSAGHIFGIKSRIEEVLDRQISIQDAMKCLDDWIKAKGGDIYNIINSLIASTMKGDKQWFELRKASFVRVFGASKKEGATIEYKCQNKLLFGREDDLLHITGRPGWRGLAAPGSCFILSIKCNQTTNMCRGSILHQIDGAENFGVVSRVVDPCLKSPFFVALMEAYLGHATRNSFIGIQIGEENGDKRNEFLVHMTQTRENTYLNYCPRDANIYTQMAKAIETIRKLLPFVPRSVLVKHDIPLSAIEVMSIGPQEYIPRVIILDDPPVPVPLAYHVNRDVMEWLAADISRVSIRLPQYRFAMTGESFCYQFVDGRQVEVNLEYPDTRPTLDTVFGEFASHMVVLVDADAPQIPGQAPIPWTGPRKAVQAEMMDPTETIGLINRVFALHGTVSRSADIFTCVFNNNKLKVKDGNIAEDMRKSCMSPDGLIIDCNYYTLQKSFIRLVEKRWAGVSIRELTTEATTKKTDNPNPDAALQQLHQRIRQTLKLEEHLVAVQYMGNEGVAIRIEQMALEPTLHPKATTLLDVDYRPCQADNIIKACMNPAWNPSICHNTCIGFDIKHYTRQGLSVEAFTKAVQTITSKFGFFVSCASEYEHIYDDPTGYIGYIFVEINDIVVARSFADAIIKAIPVDSGFDPERQMTMTRSVTQTVARQLTIAKNAGGPRPPRVGIFDTARVIPESEMDTIKELLDMEMKNGSNWRLDENYRILVVPYDEEKKVHRLMAKVNAEKCDKICFYICDDDPEAISPDPIYIYQQDGSVTVAAICQQCLVNTIQDFVNPFFSTNTHMIDLEVMTQQPVVLDPIPVVPPDPAPPDVQEIWPNIPFGALMWTLVADKRGVGPYAKAWLTGTVEIALRARSPAIGFCPNHSLFCLRLPKPGCSMKCQHCNMMFCADCSTWHDMDQPCMDMPGVKKCPRCKAPGIKESGCNRITCGRCNCSWCYQCQVSEQYNTPAECYAHLQAVHGGYWAPVD